MVCFSSPDPGRWGRFVSMQRPAAATRPGSRARAAPLVNVLPVLALHPVRTAEQHAKVQQHDEPEAHALVLVRLGHIRKKIDEIRSHYFLPLLFAWLRISCSISGPSERSRNMLPSCTWLQPPPRAR